MNQNKKHLAIIITLLCVIVISAMAAGNKITLDSSKPIQDQIDTFKEWYNKLDFMEQARWDLAFGELTDPWAAENTQIASLSSEETEQMVWIPRTGSKYHSKGTCSNMKNPDYVTLDEALDRGYDKCSKCW